MIDDDAKQAAREALAAGITKAVGPALLGKIGGGLKGSAAGEHIGDMYQKIWKAIKAG